MSVLACNCNIYVLVLVSTILNDSFLGISQLFCVALKRKCIKEYFHNISNNNSVTNKNFSNFIRPFLVNKGLLNSEIMLRKENEIITDTKK